MARYIYEVIARDGRVVKGELNSASMDAAKAQLMKQGATIVKLESAKTNVVEYIKNMDVFNRVNDQELAIVNRQLATLINVGITISRALEIVARHAVNLRLQEILRAVCADVSRGTTFSRALSRFPQVFSVAQVAMVKAGESIGMMGKMLEDIANLQEREYQTKKRLSAAMTYPIFVMVFSIIIVVLFTLYFIPKFTGIYKQMNLKLPLITRVVIGFTELMLNPFFLFPLIAIILILTYLLINYLRTWEGRMVLDTLKFKVPLFGKLIQRTTIARFCANFASLYNAGVPLAPTLSITGEICDNLLLRRALDDTVEKLREGVSISTQLREYSFIPKAVPEVMAVGEETGEIKKLLDKLVEIYELEAQTATESLWKILEPMVITFLAVAIGIIMLAVFLPLYGLINTL